MSGEILMRTGMQQQAPASGGLNRAACKRRRQVALSVLLLLMSSASGMAQRPVACADTALLGRVVNEASDVSPQRKGRPNIAVAWTLRVNVTKVYKGRVHDKTILVNAVANSQFRMDADVLFQLKRLRPGRYRMVQSDMDCER